MLGESGARRRVELNLPEAAQASAFQTKIEAADAGEQTAESQHWPKIAGFWRKSQLTD
jgi:hypothetical protein